MKNYLKAIVFTIIILLNACGGGTTGTGDTRSASFNGRILTSDSLTISGAEVTVLETGDSVLTDTNGEFVLNVEISGSSANLLINYQGKEGTAQVNNIPTGNAVIDLDIKIDILTGNVEIISIEVNPIETPVPNQTPVPGKTPVPDKSGESVIEGLLLYSNNIPVKGAVVKFAAANSAARTGADGKFSINFDSFNGSSTLKITKDRIKAELKLGGFKKSEDVKVTLKLKLEIASTTEVGTSSNGLVAVTVEKQTREANT